MPVSTLICCDLDDCAACSLSPLLSAPSLAGNTPPSRLRVSWIFVSLVSRLMVALRILFSLAIADGLYGAFLRCDSGV